MKHHCARNWLYCIIGMIVLVGVVVCFAAYRPAVGTDISNKNGDWGNFGSFFWGFGTMCFTCLNVVIFYHIEQKLYRKQLYDTYRDALDELLKNFLSLKANNNIVTFDAKTKRSIISMNGLLGTVSESNSYCSKVEKYAAKLLDNSSRHTQQANYDDYAKFISELAGFQVCLITNSVAE